MVHIAGVLQSDFIFKYFLFERTRIGTVQIDPSDLECSHPSSFKQEIVANCDQNDRSGVPT